MRAAQLLEPAPAEDAPLRIVDVPRPEPGLGEVRVDVTACAVCRTDLQIVEGDLPARRLPVIPGHQVTGVVSAVGTGVVDRAVGDRVGVAWIAGTCGRCDHCRAGRENLCERAELTGWDRDGGYADALVARADFTHPLPEHFADLDAAPLLCGGAIGYRTLHVAEVEDGQRVGLYGFGSSASLVIQVALARGCEVYVCTRSEREQERARRMGAVWAGGAEDPPPVALDAAITFAPVGSVVVAALRALRRGGIVAVNAIHLDRIPEFGYELLWWERQIRSVANVTRDDVRDFLRLAAEIGIRTETEVISLEDIGDALLRLREGRVTATMVIDQRRSADNGVAEANR
ncbi:MAG: zinc-dependent alcohol dehydrogenase family protein [Actinomycetota bacterium]|nr:zinc-dependent alcohol dehydrogenase family protein [Actinomycetota bacterium]